MSVSLIDGHIDDDVLTDEQIIKALECFADQLNGAFRFVANEKGAKEYYETLANALDLINRQKANAEGLTNNERILIAKNKRLEEEKQEYWQTVEKLLGQHHEKDIEYEQHIRELRSKNTEFRDELEKRNTAEILYFKETIREETKKEVAKDILDAICECIEKGKTIVNNDAFVSCKELYDAVGTMEEIMLGAKYHYG